MKKILLLIIVFSFLFGVSAFAQEDTLDPGLLPDSPFYFLKTWRESIHAFFTFGAENKVKQFLHLSEVRLAEYQKMIEKGKTEIAEKTLEKYERQLNQALEKAEEAKEKGKDVENLVILISEKTSKHQEILSGVLEKVSEQAKSGIEKAIEMSKKGYETAIETVSEIKKEREKMEKECLEEGKTYMPGEYKQCCIGLKGISLSVGDGRICSLTAGYTCSAFCGDGECRGEYENACSCPEDCPKSEKEEISCTTNSDCGVDSCQQGRDKCVEIKYVCENGKCSGISKEYKNYSCARYYYGSINFTGGTILEVEYKKVRPETRVIAEKFADLFESISIQPTGEKGIILKMKYIDEVTHQQVLQRLGEVEEKYFESVRGTIDYSKCMDTCGDDICRLPETKDWCPEDCLKQPEQVIDETAGWKIYRDEEYGFEFKYSNEITFSSPVSTSRNIFMINSWTNQKSSKDKPAVGLFISLLDGPGEKILKEEKDLLDKQTDELNEIQEIKLGENLGLKNKNICVTVSDVGGGVSRTATVAMSTFKDKYFYSFQCSQAGNNLNLCDQIISTFKFIK